MVFFLKKKNQAPVEALSHFTIASIKGISQKSATCESTDWKCLVRGSNFLASDIVDCFTLFGI